MKWSIASILTGAVSDVWKLDSKQSSESLGMSGVCVILLDGVTSGVLPTPHWGHKGLRLDTAPR